MELLKAITALSLVRKVDFTGLPGHARPRDAKGFVRLGACKEDIKTLRALSPQEKGKLPVIIMLADFTGLPGRARPLPTKGFVRQSAQSSHPKKTLHSLRPHQKSNVSVLIVLAVVTELPGQARPPHAKGFVRQSTHKAHTPKLCARFALKRKAT